MLNCYTLFIYFTYLLTYLHTQPVGSADR